MFSFFWFMASVVVTAHFIIIAVLAGCLAAKAIGWLWDRIWRR